LEAEKMKNIVHREGDEFEILNKSDRYFEGVRLPISCLPDIIKGFEAIINRKRFETGTISIGFYDDHLEKKNQIKKFFFIHILKIGKFLTWHRDDANAILDALMNFQDTNKRQVVSLSWPQNN
jgi:hypothetical protein